MVDPSKSASKLSSILRIPNAHPVNSSDQVACFINGDNLQIVPASDYFGNFEIAVYAYDDFNPGYELNTYSDQFNFNLIVESVNDEPIRLNYFEDLVFPEADFCNPDLGFSCPYTIDISSYIIDVDDLIMNEEALSYMVSSSNDIVSLDLISNLLNINFLGTGTTEISLSATDGSGAVVEDGFHLIIEEILDAESVIPLYFKLNDVYPNPFNPTAHFNVDIPYNTMLTIDVYNILGQKVDNIYNGFILAGIHNMNWTPKVASSGIYFLNMKTENFNETKKMIMLK